MIIYSNFLTKYLAIPTASLKSKRLVKISINEKLKKLLPKIQLNANFSMGSSKTKEIFIISVQLIRDRKLENCDFTLIWTSDLEYFFSFYFDSTMELIWKSVRKECGALSFSASYLMALICWEWFMSLTWQTGIFSILFPLVGISKSSLISPAQNTCTI